jgi:hypothetical protein
LGEKRGGGRNRHAQTETQTQKEREREREREIPILDEGINMISYHPDLTTRG